MPSQIKLPLALYYQIVNIAEEGLPYEVCGILAGLDGRVREVIKIKNSNASPVSYSLDPENLVQAIWKIDEAGHEILAFFHSHPDAPPTPSQTDIENHYYPGIPHLILGRATENEWQGRAYLLDAKFAQEISLLVE